MLVKNWMSQPVITVEATDTIKAANEILSKNHIRSIPVMSEGELVGIITDRDLKQASISGSTSLEAPEIVYLNTRIPLSKIMTCNVTTVTPYTTVDEVANLLLNKKISGVPVVDNSGKLVGMITQGDIFRLLISLTGLESRGIQIAVKITSETGKVKEVADTVRKMGGRIDSLLTSNEGIPEGFRFAFFKAYNIESEKIEELIDQLKQIAEVRYVVEHLEDHQPSKIWLMNE